VIKLPNILEIDISFPGFSFGYESWALETYLKVLNDHLSVAQDQYRLRANRELDREREKLEPVEIAIEEQKINEATEIQIPRFFHNGALLQIWGLFESFVFDIAHYVGRQEKSSVVLKDIRANNFRKQIEKYFEGVLRLELPWTNDERISLGYLQELRNIVAHRNGRLMDLNPDKRKEIETLVNATKDVRIVHSTVMLSSSYISEAAELVFGLVTKLNDVVGNRYFGTTT